MKTSKLAVWVIALGLLLTLVVGCATNIDHNVFRLSDGRFIDYITGKVAGDGQEANFRDAYVDGKPVVSHYGSGQSLTGQVLQGAVSSALIAGGMVGGAAVLRPTRINQSENETVDNHSGQVSNQSQGQASTATSSSKSSASQLQNQSVTVRNRNHVGDIGGGSGNGGDFNGCESQGNSGSKNPHC